LLQQRFNCKVALSEAILWLRLRIAATDFLRDGRRKDFRENVSQPSPVSSIVSSERTRSNLTSVFFNKGYVTQNLYTS
jgi:hypothetical protein